MSGDRIKDYNPRQRAVIEEEFKRLRGMNDPGNWRVVDTKLTKHTRSEFEAGNLQRFELRTVKQVELYKFHVIHR